MPVKWLMTIMLILPAMLYAKQEEDIDLFEFLAIYEQGDNAFIDAEMDERIETVKTRTNDNLSKQNLTNQEVMKSGADEQ